jgi:tagatose 1,6-diphosphate aldolase
MDSKLTVGKIKHLQALSNERGVIAAAAIDQRGSLQKSIASSRGIAAGEVTDDMMKEFKIAVSKVLTPYASAILLDPQWGLEAAAARDKNCGLLLAYEESGYDNAREGRRPDLLPHLSARRIVDLGADAVKILIYYTPFEEESINDEKHAFIERVGAECRALDIPFFLEFVGYDAKGGDEKGFEYAKKKPEIVGGCVREFTQDKYGVDILKVEVPVNMAYAEGASYFTGQKAYSKQEVFRLCHEVAQMATKPFIFLSAGVTNQRFTEQLRWMAEGDVNFSGVLCGRATWLDGVPVYAKGGYDALVAWLKEDGVRNIQAVNECLKAAKPWYKFYGAQSAEDLLNANQLAARR